MSDPTNTAAIRQSFLNEVRRRFRRLRGLIRQTVGYENDAFGLTAELAEPKETFDYPTDEAMITAFIAWLKKAFREEVLEPAPMRDVVDGKTWTATYIRAAYGRGWENARSRLRTRGVQVGESLDVQSVFDLPVPRRQLRKLYTRTFENLRDITPDIADQIRDELTRGLAEGVNPRVMADRITERVSTIQKTRAEVIARSETINSYSVATLDRYESAGVSVVSHGEWRTAQDGRVCPICKSLDGNEYTIGEMREGTFEFEANGDDVPDSLAGTYRLKPPAHCNGRCVILPSL